MEAELVMGLSQRLRVSPMAGGALDQPVAVLRMLRVLELAGGEEASGSSAPALDLSDLQELL